LGNKILSHSQIRSIAQVDDKLVFLIDPHEIEERLSQFPEVYKATVNLRWPNHVEIQVVEREPVVEWNDAGRIWWVSLDGVAFIQHGTWPELVQVKTIEPTLQINKEPLDPVIAPRVVKAAVRLNSRLPEIATLQYDKERGLWLEDSNGWMVYFGIEGDMDLKADVYRAMVEQLSEKQAQISLVSLEDQAAPYYRMKR
jgi:cell division septal protein FtsQ